MQAVRIRSRHFNGRMPNGLISVIRLRDKSSYARDKNTSAELCAKNAGGGLCAREGVFAGHYSIFSKAALPNRAKAPISEFQL